MAFHINLQAAARAIARLERRPLSPACGQHRPAGGDPGAPLEPGPRPRRGRANPAVSHEDDGTIGERTGPAPDDRDDEDCGYALDDPKHPTYDQRYADWVDHTRKARREDA